MIEVDLWIWRPAPAEVEFESTYHGALGAMHGNWGAQHREVYILNAILVHEAFNKL